MPRVLVTFIPLACLLFAAVPSAAHAAQLLFTPSSGNFPAGQNFTVRVTVDSQGQQVNAADAAISFDPAVLNVVSISKDGSAFSLWPAEPSFSNSAGTITLSGGTPSPFTGQRPIVTITFRPVREGSASVTYTSGTVLAADGRGTNVYQGSTPASYTITAAAAPTQPEPEPETPTNTFTGSPPRAPEIESPSHEEEDLWYSASTTEFVWEIPYGVIAVKVAFDNTEGTEPTEEIEPPVAEYEIENVADGVWYFHLAYRNRGGWGPAAHRKVQVDSTPPEEFELVSEGRDLSALFTFSTTDALSGIEKYVITVDRINKIEVFPDDLVDNAYLVTDLDPGPHTVSVEAFDKAGNIRRVEGEVAVTGTLPSDEPVVEETSPFGLVYWVSMIFSILLAIMGGYVYYERKKYREEKDRIKREALEVGDKLVNIFEVLREEIEEKVIMLSTKPNMSDNERRILEGLKDSLDISEELLDKEVEDVRKLLR
jgi:hypothetical protein